MSHRLALSSHAARAPAIAALSLLSLLVGCGGDPKPATTKTPAAAAPAQPAGGPPGVAASVAPKAAAVRPGGPMQPRPPLPKARPAPTGTFFGLGPIQADKDRRKHPFYTGPKPPPRTGEVIELVVPPPGPAPGAPRAVAPPAGGLKVARAAPKGRVGLVNALTAQFNQPMVPVGSLKDLRRWPVPLTLSPGIDAKARWLGTQTVALESAKRLPYSTAYTASVPAGTRAASGQTLAKPYAWTFETPRLHVTRRQPSGKQVRPEAVVVLGFDQDVRADRVAGAVKLTRGGRRIGLAAVPAKAWKTLPRVGAGLASANPKRTVVLRPLELLPVDSAFTVTLPTGSYSAEGPLPTEKAISWGFRTYPPLRIDRGYCEWRDKRKGCREGNAISVKTTTALASDQDLSKLVKVTPKPDDLEIRAAGRGLSLTGAFLASSTYRVTIAKGLRDVFGQTTRKRWRASFSYRDGEPVLQLASTRPVALERGRAVALNARVRNLSEVKLHLMRVGPSGLAAAHRRLGSRWYPRKRNPMDRLTGTGRTSRTVATRVAKNKLGITSLDLAPALGGDKSGVIAVAVEAPWPYDKGWFSSKDAYASLLVQVTGVGVTARWDHERVVAYVANLDTGKPLANADVQLIDGKGGTLQSGKTDARGVLELPCKPWSYREVRFLWASVGQGKGKDVGFLHLGRRLRGPGAPTMRGFTWTDRDPYKPGEQAHLTGMLRVHDPAKLGGVLPVTDAEQVEWTLFSARGHKLSKGETQVATDGSFYVELDLPDDMDLGSTRFHGRVVGGRWNGRSVQRRFQVQQYRTPAFKVAAAIKPGAVAAGRGSGAETTLRFGSEATLEVSGRYYFGAPMAGAKAHYLLRRSTTRYRPPGHGGWTFGRVPVHSWRSRWRGRRGRPGNTGAVLAQGQGTLGPDGRWQIPHLLDATLRDAKGAPVRHKGEPQQLQGPASYRLETWVEDDARQRISARTAATVHQGTTYAGLKLARTVLKVGQSLQLSVVAAHVSGKRQARKVQVRLLRLVPDKKRRWSHAPSFGRRGGYGGAMPWLPTGYREVEAGRCTATTTLTPGKDGKPAPATCALPLAEPGHYRVRAQVKDEHGATTVSELDAYAHGPKRVRWSVHDVSKVELVPDKTSYEPGETATVLVKSPFPAARGLLSVARNGLVSWQIIDVPRGAAAVKIPVDPRWVPGATVQVTLFSGRDHSARPGAAGDKRAADAEAKPRTATGELVLPVARSDKRIDVAIAASKAVVTPGATVDVQVKTTDKKGAPVASHVTLWAVDEGVLALLGYATPDPLTFFHRPRSALTAGDDLRARILVERFAKVVGSRRPQRRRSRKGGGDSAAMGGMRMKTTSVRAKRGASRRSAPPPMEDAEAEEAPMAAPADADVGGGGPAPTLRQLFAATAFFKSRVAVNGAATVQVKLPDNATTFRLMAVADAGVDQFGSGDGQLTTRQPVLLRAALPRFANLHDDFDAAAVLHNETGAPQTFVVGARGSGVSWHDTFEKTVTLDSGASTEVRFRVRATKTGRATFQFAARVQGSQRADYADAVQRSIPVNLPATLEAFATYGSTTSSVLQPIQAPLDAIASFGGLDVTLSSTALSGLEDATRYLLEYPYECAEQTASRLIPIAVLGELLDQFQIGTYQARATRAALVKRAVKRLVGLQHWDGGFKFWPKSRKSSRWVTPWVTYALLLAKEQGAEVPANALRKANNFLLNQVRRSAWSQSWWRVSDALSLWVLTHKANPNRVAKGSLDRPFNRLTRERAKLPMFAQAWLMAVAHRRGATAERDAILRTLDNAVVEKAGTAHIAEGKSEDLRVLMHSSDRTDAIVLGALVEVKPAHASVSKLIRGLMEGRIKGRWSTTQANAWALVTARRYFDVYEKATPAFATQLWLGKGYLGTQKFQGRSLAKAHAHVPMALVLKRTAKDGRVAKVPPPSAGSSSGRSAAVGKVVDLVLAKQGQGRMYYRVGMRYAPKSLRLPAEEQGFTVQRRYEALNPAEQDRVKQLPDGTWRVRAGTDVRVQLTVVVPTRGHYVVVDDPLPAGFEGQNPAFRTSNSAHQHVPNKRGGGWRWYAWWRWDHIEMRDDRVLLFADRLWSGVYSHSYVARATSIGRFVVPPARAEEMYAPETFGRNATTFVEVVP